MKDACVIGAGVSGLPSAKALLDQGLAFDWFEMASAVGGNWRFDNDNGRAAAYASLHIDTSKERMAYEELPMPPEWPEYLHHTQVLRYLEMYAERFDLVPHCTFRTEVTEVRPVDGGWSVRTRSLDTGEESVGSYRAVLVANGHHWNPYIPEWPGELTAESFHSHRYRHPDVFAGKRALVLGMGNSATDIAVDATRTASRVVVSTRRGAHVVPRFILGKPTDQWVTPESSRLPLWLQRIPYRALLWLARGPQRRYGVPVPPNRLLEEHPTMSQEFLPLVREGRITVRPDIARFEGDTVHFVDDTREEFDVVVFATGYTISFPFLEPDVLKVEDNDIRLYKRVVDPDRPGLFFIGLIQPLGAIMPLAEAQAKWVARLLRGAPLPDPATMRQEIAEEHSALQRRYVRSRRHTIQVDYWPYLLEMRQLVEEAERELSPVGN